MSAESSIVKPNDPKAVDDDGLKIYEGPPVTTPHTGKTETIQLEQICILS